MLLKLYLNLELAILYYQLQLINTYHYTVAEKYFFYQKFNQSLIKISIRYTNVEITNIGSLCFYVFEVSFVHNW